MSKKPCKPTRKPWDRGVLGDGSLVEFREKFALTESEALQEMANGYLKVHFDSGEYYVTYADEMEWCRTRRHQHNVATGR